MRVGGTQLTIWKEHMAGRWWMLTEKETGNCSVALEKESLRSKQCVQNSYLGSNFGSLNFIDMFQAGGMKK